MELNFESEVQVVNDRPIPKESIVFFRNHKGHRVFISISKPNVWKKDLAIAEKTSTSFIVIPTISSMSDEIQTVRTILKERFRYPGAKDTPEIMEIAKTWVLSSKVFEGPNLSEFMTRFEKSNYTCGECRGEYGFDAKKLCILKLELDDFSEKRVLDQILGSGWAPGILIIKWSCLDRNDECIRGICTCSEKHSYRYTLISQNNGYYFYVYTPPSAQTAIDWWITQGTPKSILGRMIEGLKEQKLGWLNLIADCWSKE